MTHPLAPTIVLPALATLPARSAARVGEALLALQDLYFPHPSPSTPIGAVPVLKQSLSDTICTWRPKQTAHLVHHDGVPDSGYASAEEDEYEHENGRTIDEEELEDGNEALDVLRSDELERGYAIKWLTGLMKRGDAWVCGTCDSSSEEQDARTARLEDTSRLLARFAGDDEPEEALTRTFVFPFNMPSCRDYPCQNVDMSSSLTKPITVELNDAPVNGTDHTAVGLQSWGSAIVFAERMCLDPERYLGALDPCSSATIKDATTTTAPLRRILELGAGTGLLSITATQILSRTSVRGKIKATDYHPSVLENLARNVAHNPGAVGISVEKLDWCVVSTDVDLYDVVLAADVVYHPEHAHWIRGSVERMLKKDGVFWLIIPLRTVGRHAGLEETVEKAFPVVDEGKTEREADRLAIVSSEEVTRVDGVGRADEGGYSLFEIRWV